MDNADNLVIVGGGHAAAQLCAGLVAAGRGAHLHLVCEEAELPYHRPPLSKTFLKGADQALQPHRPEPWYADSGITVHLADPAVAIDAAQRRVTLRSGRELAYAQLVLATGARTRHLPALPEGLDNVALLRSAADATRLRSLLSESPSLTVLGGGFIGLEVAATAQALGKRVTVLEAAPRLLTRSLCPEVAEHVLQTHRASGIDIRLGVTVGEFEVQQGRLVTLTVDGVKTPVDLLLPAIGAAPETGLARSAGLACDDGILVDAYLRTSDPAIFAVGDCTRFPSPSGARLRMESVQNANDQARTLLSTLAGRHEPYTALPWFWSDQGPLRLQMAGLMPAGGVRHRRPGATAQSFSVLHYAGDRLACVESVNAPMDHMMSRKLLEAGRSPAPEVACDPAVALKTLL